MKEKPPHPIQTILTVVAWVWFFGMLNHVWIELPKWLLDGAW